MSFSSRAMIALAASAFVSAQTADADTTAGMDALNRVLSVACQMPWVDAQRLRPTVPGGRIITHKIDELGGRPGRVRTVILTDGGAEIEVSLVFPGNRLRRADLQYSDPDPKIGIKTDAECNVIEARTRTYDADGRPAEIHILGPDMTSVTQRVALNPPVQTAPDPGGVAVAVIDSGVNYTLAPFKDRLARNPNGELVGRDFWDGDDRPFDIDTGRSPFFPLHHGSAVTSILLAEAPTARVLPVRYPRPDMTKMADAVDWIAAQGVKIVNLAMGSNSEAEWAAFAAAARRHPRILFLISAGNNGRNIDAAPVYPASLKLPNAIVVTSSELNGRLARGSNWGPESVDVMVPGERIDVIDHRGAPGKASGSSFAVPRVTALAVRLLEANPSWHGPELRAAILNRAKPASGRKLTRYGWIPDPTDGP